MTTNVVVLDALMGSGKTTFITTLMNETYLSQSSRLFEDPTAQVDPYIYIGLYLEEAERIKEDCPHLEFTEPEPVNGRKLHHLNELIRDRRNISSTHALFKMVNRETYDALKEANYTLVVDECFECVRHFNEVSLADWKMLTEGGYIFIDKDNRVRWDYEKHPEYEGKFDAVRSLCDNGNLMQLSDGIYFWELPVEFLSLFKQVYICTYLFDGSAFSSYLKAKGINYNLMSLDVDRKLIDHSMVDESAQKAKLRSLISISEDPGLNSIGKAKTKGHPLSSSWFDRELRKKTDSSVPQLKLSLIRYFKHKAPVPVSDRMWTVFEKAKRSTKGDGYTKGFVPCNARATNDYRHKKTLAYAVNVFMQPPLKRYFQSHRIEPNEDLYALSEMVQWIWRSQIRDGEPIDLYVPSERMRGLLKTWLDNEVVQEIAPASIAA